MGSLGIERRVHEIKSCQHSDVIQVKNLVIRVNTESGRNLMISDLTESRLGYVAGKLDVFTTNQFIPNLHPVWGLPSSRLRTTQGRLHLRFGGPRRCDTVETGSGLKPPTQNNWSEFNRRGVHSLFHTAVQWVHFI